jgi:hypothetical protein
VARPLDDAPPSRGRHALIQVGAAVTIPGGGPPGQLVVFRAVHGPFTAPTTEVLKLAALHVATALHVVGGPAPSASQDPPAVKRHSGA